MILKISVQGFFRAELNTEFPIGGEDMSRVCSVCGKGRASGNNVSHSNRKTRRAFNANVQKVTYKAEGKVTTDYFCARCLKSDKIERI